MTKLVGSETMSVGYYGTYKPVLTGSLVESRAEKRGLSLRDNLQAKSDYATLVVDIAGDKKKFQGQNRFLLQLSN